MYEVFSTDVVCSPLTACTGDSSMRFSALFSVLQFGELQPVFSVEVLETMLEDFGEILDVFGLFDASLGLFDASFGLLDASFGLVAGLGLEAGLGLTVDLATVRGLGLTESWGLAAGLGLCVTSSTGVLILVGVCAVVGSSR